MRLLLVHNQYRQPGGEDSVVSIHQSLLTSAGHEVSTYIETNPDGAFASTLRLAVSPWNPSAANRVRAVIRANPPTLAHVHNTWYSLTPSVLRVLKSESIPTVMSVHNYRLSCINAQLLRDGNLCELCVGTHPWRGVAYGCYRNSRAASTLAATTLALNRGLGTWTECVGMFMALTEFMRTKLIASGIPGERVVVVPNCVIDPGPRSNAPHASNRVLFVGRLSAEKGVDVLVEAWDAVRPRGLELVVIGEGPLKSGLVDRAVPGVVFAGALSRSEVMAEMLSARALAFPSIWYEGQPMVLLEALAAGLPVIAPSYGGIAETLGPALWPVQPGGWKDALAALVVESDQALDQLGAAGRARYEDEFQPERIVGLLMHTYGQMTHWQQQIQ